MKKMVLLLLVCSRLLFAQDAIRFRGAYLGEPLSDFADCSSGKIKVIKQDYNAHGQFQLQASLQVSAVSFAPASGGHWGGTVLP